LVQIFVQKKQATSIDAHVGHQVRARREVMGMSQGKLGELLGLTFQQVQKYEKGVNRIGAGRLFEIARILGVGVLYFYDGMVEGMSGRPLGFAEDEAPAPSPPENRFRELAQLSAGFARVSDPKARKRILKSVEELAGSQKQQSQPRRKR
jgi:transcriptional regulator with XRE-family HTH domain